MNPPKEEKKPDVAFQHVVHSQDGGAGQHSIGITTDGRVYSWGKHNRLGQLGRPTNKKNNCRTPQPVVVVLGEDDKSATSEPIRVRLASVGGRADSGHSVLVDTNNRMYVTGCDRWQQLGLGSPNGGAGGYTWQAIYRNTYIENTFVPALLANNTIRDVACGGDHTVVLSSNQHDVVTFGKGDAGQLGLSSKPFLSSPTKSSKLSISQLDQKIAAVCAILDCSLTLDENGHVLKQVGKCQETLQSFHSALRVCRERAESFGLITQNKEKQRNH